MPNIIVEINQEMGRVRALLPRLDSIVRYHAEEIIRHAKQSITQNDYEGMTEALANLRLFTKEQKK